jgi:hypothetical protein
VRFEFVDQFPEVPQVVSVIDGVVAVLLQERLDFL